MQILAINQQFNTQKPKTLFLQPFGARKITPKFVDLSSDIFERITKPDSTSDIFYKHVDNINKRIKERMIGFTPEQLETAINEVKIAHPDISERKILTVMQRLTQWADYNCFATINHHLNPFQNGFTAQNFDHKNRVFHYLQQKKILCYKMRYTAPRTYFVDAKNIDLVKKDKTNNALFINLEGFEDGVNFLSDNNELASKTINTITKIKDCIKSHKSINFKEGLNEILNGELFNKAIKKDIHVHTIRRKRPATRETILEQMSPIQPKHPDVIKILFELLAKKYTTNNPEEFEKLRNAIAQFFDYKFLPFSKQGMIEDLKLINLKIIDNLKEKSIPNKNVFLTVTENIKSYDLISEMFSRIANIPNKNFKIIKTINDFNKPQNKSAFLILDDISISGHSIEDFILEDGHYKNPVKQDCYRIFAPISAHDEAIDIIHDGIWKVKREDFDTITILDKNIIQRNSDSEYYNLLDYFDKNKNANNALGYEGYEDFHLATVFPYSTPDNNCDLASFLIKYFLPQNASIESKHNDFNEVEFEMNHSAKMAYLLQFIKNLGKN